MKKTLDVIDNPRLDRIFTDAYRNTMKEVALREQDKHDSDYLSVFTDLFEKDLYTRDLSSEERQEFMAVFREEIGNLQENAAHRSAKKRKFALMGTGSLLLAALLAFGIYLAVARPFMPVTKITDQLDYQISKVNEGYGSYAKRFYRLLDRRGGKLPPGIEEEYSESMYALLDNHFDETVLLLEQGEVRFYDDAKQWASRFPDPEERADRKEIAENAFKKGIGEAVGETLDDVKKGARNFLRKAAKAVKDAVGNNN